MKFRLFPKLLLAAFLAFPPLFSVAHSGEGPHRLGPLKAGVDAFVRPESAGNFLLADSSFIPGNGEERLVVRLRPSLEAAPAEWITARAEGQWYAWYDDTDRSEISLYQGYVEARLPGSERNSFRAGRQEVSYGSAFLLGSDGFHDGLSFDAVKIVLAPSRRFSVELFDGRYVERNSGGIEGKLSAAYARIAPCETVSVDIYALSDRGGVGATHPGGEHERTHSAGTRITGGLGENVSFEVEPVWQFGRKGREGGGHDEIRAFGGHADLSVGFAPRGVPCTAFLSYAWGSGDGDPAAGKFTEFHNPNHDTSLLGDIGVVGTLGGLTAGESSASGLRVATAGVAADLTGRWNVSLDGHHFRAERTQGGIAKEIGVEANLVVTYRPSDSTSVVVSGNRFITGPFFRDAAGSGKDIHYAYAQLQAAI